MTDTGQWVFPTLDQWQHVMTHYAPGKEPWLLLRGQILVMNPDGRVMQAFVN